MGLVCPCISIEKIIYFLEGIFSMTDWNGWRTSLWEWNSAINCHLFYSNLFDMVANFYIIIIIIFVYIIIIISYNNHRCRTKNLGNVPTSGIFRNDRCFTITCYINCEPHFQHKTRCASFITQCRDFVGSVTMSNLRSSKTIFSDTNFPLQNTKQL